MKRPDTFVVGAFKSGTTALYEYLRAHPQIFMCVPKEPMYFGADLTPRYRRMTEQEYLALFADAQPGQRAGEASPWYLYSHSAPAEIAHFAPDARIIVMLRNPVDVMHAQHGQLVFNRREDITDFAAALEAEPARRRGERIPGDAIRPEALYYRHSVHFAEQQLAEGRVTPGADDEIGVGRGDVAAAALARPHDEPADRLVEGDVVDGQAIDLDHSGRA